MQIQNLQIYSSAIADASSAGPWIDISNLVSLSVQINTFTTAVTDIEVSNDPNVMIDGAGIGAPGSPPTLLQFASIPGFGSLQTVTPPGDVSQLPAQTFFVKTTFITKWGETTASAESSLAVTAGNYLFVKAPTPSGAQAPFVIGWNCYVGLTTGNEVLQTAPAYSPQRLIDGIGTVGGTVSPLGPGQSTHFAIAGALPLVQNFAMTTGFQSTGIVVPGADASGGTNAGVSVSSGLGVDKIGTPPDDNQAVAVFISGGNLMWSPSSMTWKFLRVTHGGASTVAYLNGQRG